jgi:C-terminal processing protease CtpA/Prc
VFRIERAPVGDVMVGCYGRGISAWTQAKVTVGQVTNVELTATSREPSDDPRRRQSGLTLENQLAEVIVQAVKSDSPAAKAGIVAGDVIVDVEGTTIGRYQAEMAIRTIEYGDTSPVKIVLERDDKQITVQLAF